MTNLLFVGGSLLMNQGIPTIVGHIYKKLSGSSCKILFVGWNGASLQEHLEKNSFSNFISKSHSSIVIFQEKGTIPYERPNEFRDSLIKCSQIVNGYGASTSVIFPWPNLKYDNRNSNQLSIYKNITSEARVSLIDINSPWQKLDNYYGRDFLFPNHDNHPSFLGATFASILIIKSIFPMFEPKIQHLPADISSVQGHSLINLAKGQYAS